MNTQEPRDYRNNTSSTTNQEQKQLESPAPNTFTDHQKQKSITTTSSPIATLLKRYQLHRIKVWHFLLLVLIIDVGIFGQAFWQEFAKHTTHTTQTAPPPMIASHRMIPDTNYKQLARLYVNHMSLEDKLGQLIVASFTASGYSPDLDTMIHQQHIGGVILFANQNSHYSTDTGGHSQDAIAS